MKALRWIPVFLLLLAAGCFSSREEVLQKDDVSSFKFMGNTERATLDVKQDGRTVWEGIALNPDERYVIKPGVYEVIVTRDGITVVRRKIFLDSGKVAEIQVP